MQNAATKQTAGATPPPPPPTLASEMVDAETMARELGIELGTIRNWVARREIPFVRLGRRTLFFRASVRDWLKGKETKPRGSK